MPYTMTRSSDGQENGSTVTDGQALRILRRGLHLHADVAADKDHIVTITRTRLVLHGEDTAERRTVLTLRPEPRAHRLTRTQYEDLTRIRKAGEAARLRADGRIGGMFCQVPPSAARRLLGRGLLVATGGDQISIGVAGLLAIAGFEHPVRTTTPRGWHDPENGRLPTTRQHRRHPYQVPDFSSTAVCTCGFRAAADRRPYAAAFARNHIEQVLSAALQNP
ncbi:hypothetical protein KGQ20_04170 [Catenulispora sp. NF23]|uniref:TubC N-terminal docking domain-containing protein n=1 Tax=Catenulispora pinistramenti TaxID=2705254 RepID=A0ABS5KIL3_9ACTN|nr:hypothetical protein [Catenulispora pinistramenti]MBS2531960.1 hypothetical protein [Catenulispora pinistramenti]MBS2546228.1 hypothetical protein [Catenulispora pinistramenti]